MITNPSEYEAKESRWQEIIACLKSHGIEAYSPGVETGDVRKKFVVVSYYGASALSSFSSETVTYDVEVFVPQKRYSELEPFIAEVKAAMEDLRPMLKLSGYESPSYYDDSIHGHVVTLEYSMYRTYNGRKTYYG